MMAPGEHTKALLKHRNDKAKDEDEGRQRTPKKGIF